MKIDTLKKRLNEEFNFSEMYESFETESFERGTILLTPSPREQQRRWINKAYNEWLRNDRTLVLVCPFKPNCKYFKRYVTDVAQIRGIEDPLIYNNHRSTNPMIIAIYWKRVIEPNFIVSFD